jgi:inorganic pyrophosphatase
MPKNPEKLPPIDRESKQWHVIIETPKGCRNKYKFDPKLGMYKLSGVLPAGAVFPFDFGFIPSTIGADGDPLDVLLLMDEPAFAGCLVSSRLIGVIEAKQTERDGSRERNDRLIAVASDFDEMKDVRTLKDLNKAIVEEIEHFFVSYNQLRGKVFKPLGRFGPKQAERIAKQGIKAFRKQDKSRG